MEATNNYIYIYIYVFEERILDILWGVQVCVSSKTVIVATFLLQLWTKMSFSSIFLFIIVSFYWCFLPQYTFFVYKSLLLIFVFTELTGTIVAVSQKIKESFGGWWSIHSLHVSWGHLCSHHLRPLQRSSHPSGISKSLFYSLHAVHSGKGGLCMVDILLLSNRRISNFCVCFFSFQSLKSDSLGLFECIKSLSSLNSSAAPGKMNFPLNWINCIDKSSLERSSNEWLWH